LSHLRRLSGLALATTITASAGCASHRPGAGASAERSRSGVPVPAKIAFAPGRWRLATYDQVAASRVWLSHIVIMHSGSRATKIGLRLGSWAPDVIPDRSREEAYRIAIAARDAARADPSAFADLAARYSDDVVTRGRGGDLGGVQATRLTPPFLDALAALQPGQVSDVVETPMGFHVALLHQPPPVASVSGARIVVRYASTQGEEPSTRTRAEAMTLAESLAAEARSGADFGALARARSENADRVRDGALGVWSTREPEPENALVLEELARMADGDISDPIDSPLGFQIVKRSPAAPAQEFAMRSIRVPIGVWSLAAGESPASLPDLALTEATRIVRELRADPWSFGRLVEGRCCKTPARWSDGHDDPVVTTAIEKLAIGQVTPVPIRVPGYYVVGQRIDPDLVSPRPKPTVGLPAPAALDLDEAVRASNSARLATSIGQLVQTIPALNLAPNEKDALTGVLQGFRSDLATATTEDKRLTAYHDELGKLHRALPEASYARVLGVLGRWAAEQALAPRGT
jgi:hypothetical protein